MKNIIGKPQALKQVNLSLVRGAIRELSSATRAEIMAATNLSVTTVRTLLTEMLENGEIYDAGQDDSMGGRKAVRYALNKDRFFGVAFCLDGGRVRYIKVNICGEIIRQGEFASGESVFDAICKFLDSGTLGGQIRSIGIGVPGIVSGMSYQWMNEAGELERNPIGAMLEQRYNIPVLLENDLNAITLGFGRCYLNEFPDEAREDLHMAYIHFEKTCVSAGFLSGGRILRGWNQFSGELGLFPVDGQMTLDDLLSGPIGDEEYARLVAQLISGICCVLNPRYVALGGAAFRQNCLGLITEAFNGMLPGPMSADILNGGDKWQDYFLGMAHLTAEQIFSSLVLVKERT